MMIVFFFVVNLLFTYIVIRRWESIHSEVFIGNFIVFDITISFLVLVDVLIDNEGLQKRHQ
jgi:hypothetical protein